MTCKKSTPGRIRTCDLRIRSPELYPAELRAHSKYFRGTTGIESATPTSPALQKGKL